MVVVAGVVVAVVIVFLIATALRRRPGTGDDPDVHDRPAAAVVKVSAIVTPVIITAFLLASFGPLSRQSSMAGATLVVRIVGHRWWWEIDYPEAGVHTANELHIPDDTKVRLELTSADVIHSWWIPQLAGKRDLIPGETTTMWISATEPGRYDGQCAEYCGIGHARMRMSVIAHSPTEFQQWLADQRQDAAPVTDPQLLAGQQVFLGSSCSYCHRVGGTNASATFGPDLTHVASRPRLAAGLIPNDAEQLARWITDPQSVKPGTLMPGVQMSPDELSKLVAYLESLN